MSSYLTDSALMSVRHNRFASIAQKTRLFGSINYYYYYYRSPFPFHSSKKVNYFAKSHQCCLIVVNVDRIERTVHPCKAA